MSREVAVLGARTSCGEGNNSRFSIGNQALHEQHLIHHPSNLLKGHSVLAFQFPPPRPKRPFAFLRPAARRPTSVVPNLDHNTPKSEADLLRTPMHADSSNTPPTKANLKAWWNHFTFTQRAKKESEARKTGTTSYSVFGTPLRESLKCASVQISTAGNGGLYVYGYIPVVVAKCGLYLKEKATEVPGTFRVNGSNKRMRELQAAFETPPRYGKSLDWKDETYITHDVASVFRRYLTQMPEPVIPYDMYHPFREALARPNYNQDEVIATYKRLIREMPAPNQYLLLYVLDLLSVFARKSDKNLMTAPNLAVIFRPGLISHPDHEMLPGEHALSQRVLEFLIEHQDWFILDVPPPSSQLGSGAPFRDDITVVDEEQSGVGGAWRLIGRDRPDLPRRRTTMECSDTHSSMSEGDMSPVAESPGSQVTFGVTRSRTLPSSRGKNSAPEGAANQERARVLRKQKRASSSQPNRSSGPSEGSKG